MKKVIFGIALCLFSCSDKTVSDFTFPSTDIYFCLSAADGADLLDVVNENALSTSEIVVYYTNDIAGENRVRTAENMKVISYVDSLRLYQLGIVVNEELADDGYSYTTVKWGDLGEDTIKCALIRPYKINQIDKLWINGRLAWESGQGERVFKISK